MDAFNAWHTQIKEDKGYPLQGHNLATGEPEGLPIAEYTFAQPSPIDETACARVFAADWDGPTLTPEEASAYWPEPDPPGLEE